jgi:hypothetical protein
MGTYTVWLKSQLKKVNVWLNNQPWWKSKFTTSTPSTPATSSNLIFKFILWTIVLGVAAIVFTSRYVSDLSGDSIVTIVVIGLVIALAIKVFRSGPSGTTKWYNNSNYQNSGLGVVAVLIVLKFAFHGVLWDRMWANGIFFVLAISVLIFALFHMRKNKAWIALAILILLFTSEHSWKERPDKKVLEIQTAQASNRPRLIDTIVDLTGSNDFYFETGNYMNVYIRAISSGKGMYYEKNAIVYFTPPNGMPFRANTKGEALPVVVDSTAKDSDALNVIPGTYHVWGVHKVAIKTEWQNPEAEAKIASN